MSTINIKETFEILKNNWPNPVGLIAGQIIGFIAASIINSKFSLGYYGLAIYVLFSVGILCRWLTDRHIPKTKGDKIGFLIAISCSDEILRQKVYEDFIFNLRRLFKDGITGDIFDITVLPERIALKIIDISTATKYRELYRANYLIWGQAKPRKIDGKKSYIINLNGQVSHIALPKEVQMEFAKEFTALLPKMVGGPEDNELLFFEFTSDLTEIVSKYIIGIAALLSGDIISSETLLRDAYGRLQSSGTSSPVHEKLLNKIPYRLEGINFTKSVIKYYEWRRTRRSELLDEVESLLKGISGEFFDQNKKDICGNLAIIQFLKYRDIQGAVKQLYMIPKLQRGGLWHFSMAFLRAYKGEMKKAYAEYCIAEELELPGEKVSEVEEFILNIIEEEPEMTQLYFCLGVFNWKIKGDLKQAVGDFNKFIEGCENGRFQYEAVRAKEWIENLEKQIKEE